MTLTDQKTVFVTGASSDIGLAVCQRYLDAGHKVIAHYRTARPQLDALAAATDNIELYQCDFADTQGLEAVLKTDKAFFERTDILVNLAADLPTGSFEDVSADVMMSAFRINVLPGILLMQVMGPAMAARGWGRIVHASSIGVKFGGGSNSFAYSLSKHALEFIPRICREWAGAGVLTNVVRIGVTDTRIHQGIAGKSVAECEALIPMGRAATPDEIATTVYWLGSDDNTYITGQVIAASGGE